jgi:peptide/nickel transport system substrate-binding protein
MKKRKIVCILVFMTIGVFFTTGISQGAVNELRVAIDLDMVRVDPATLGTTTDRFLSVNLFNGLLKFKPGTSEIRRDLVESYEVSPDGKVYTFLLRKGVKFHKGYGELTSSDVKFTIMRHLDPSVRSRDFKSFSIVDHVDAPDTYTVKVFLKRPSNDFLGILSYHSGVILSEKAVKELGSKITTEPIGTGPYQLERRIPGSEIVMTANEDYFMGPPKIKKLIFKVIPDPSVSVNAVQKGDIDFYHVENIGAYRGLQKIKDKNFIVLTNQGSLTAYYAYLNCRKEPTKNLKVRQAIAHAIDVKGIVKSFGGMVRSNPSVFPSMLSSWTDKLPTYKYDVEMAKKLLKEAGYDRTTKIKVYYVKFGLHEDFAVMVKDYLSKIMDVDLVMLDVSTFQQFLKEGKWDVYSQGLTRATEDIFASGFFHSKGPGNDTGYENGELDQVIEKADMERDPSKSKKLYIRMQEIMAENLPYVPLGEQNTTVIMKKGLKGIIPEAHTGVTKFDGAYFE